MQEGAKIEPSPQHPSSASQQLKSLTRRHWRELLLSLFVLLPGALFSIGNINMIIGDVGLQEDAFYYFTIARRFVSGDGFTLDGTNLTNGFHPLHMLLLLPGASFCSLLGFLRLPAPLLPGQPPLPRRPPDM